MGILEMKTDFERICISLIFHHGGKSKLSTLRPEMFSGVRSGIVNKLFDNIFSYGTVERDILNAKLTDEEMIEFSRCLDFVPGQEAIGLNRLVSLQQFIRYLV